MAEMMTIKTIKPPNAPAMLPATQPALVHTHPAPASRLACQCGRPPLIKTNYVHQQCRANRSNTHPHII